MKMQHIIEDCAQKKELDCLCDFMDQMPQDLKGMIVSRSADDQRYGLRSIIRRFLFYVRKEEYEPLCRAAWIDRFVWGGFFPVEVFREDWEVYGEEIIELLKAEQMLLKRINLCFPLFVEDSKGDMVRSDYWKIRQNLTVYLVYACIYCNRMGECRGYLDEALTYSKRNIDAFFKELEKRPNRIFGIDRPGVARYMQERLIWLEPLHWIAMESGYDVVTRIVFPYYWEMLMYLEERADETMQGDEVNKLLHHAYWKMDTLAEFAHLDILQEIEDIDNVVSFQKLEKHYFVIYQYAHGRLGELHRVCHASGRGFHSVRNNETTETGQKHAFERNQRDNNESAAIACPYKDELTSYERDMLRKAIYSADIIITDGDKAVGLSYMPEKRGDYAPVTMGYVREEKNPGILAALAEEKYIVHDAPLTRYLHSFDNPYWEIPTVLYQIMAKLYAQYYNEFKPERNLIRIEEWMKNRHGNSKNTRL